MKSMQRWLRNYENSRHSKNPKEPNEFWTSSKYPIENMDWRQVQQIYIPELGCHWGGACSALKKLWKSYRIAGRNYGVDSRRDICWKIRNIQTALGIEKTHFEELEGMIDDEESEEGLSVEEVELQREEKEENGGDWNLHFDYRERSKPTTDEWSSEDKQLLQEEIAEEQENDDWW
jgi:hypothetical protein